MLSRFVAAVGGCEEAERCAIDDALEMSMLEGWTGKRGEGGLIIDLMRYEREKGSELAERFIIRSDKARDRQEASLGIADTPEI